MLTEESACSLLGLSCPSNAEKARKAYRKLAKTHHPDTGGDEERFKELSAAHQFLIELYTGAGKRSSADPPEWEAKRNQAQQKAAWDAWRTRARQARQEQEQEQEQQRQRKTQQSQQSQQSQESQQSQKTSSQSEHAHSHDARSSSESVEIVDVEIIPSVQERIVAWGDQVAQRLAGGLSKLYRRTARAHFEAGRDKSLKLNIDLETLLHGKQQRIRVRRLVPCPTCQIGAAITDDQPAAQHAIACPMCLGVARIKIAEELSVMIPPGADDGHKLRVAGKGRAGLKGQESGDLYLELIPPDLPQGFKRKGSTLLLELAVPIAILKRGGSVQAQTPRGTIAISIPAQSHSGKQLKISNQGLSVWGKSSKTSSVVGDLIVTLRAR